MLFITTRFDDVMASCTLTPTNSPKTQRNLRLQVQDWNTREGFCADVDSVSSLLEAETMKLAEVNLCRQKFFQRFALSAVEMRCWIVPRSERCPWKLSRACRGPSTVTCDPGLDPWSVRHTASLYWCVAAPWRELCIALLHRKLLTCRMELLVPETIHLLLSEFNQKSPCLSACLSVCDVSMSRMKIQIKSRLAVWKFKNVHFLALPTLFF